MSTRLAVLLSLILAAAGSSWLMQRASQQDEETATAFIYDPDYFMEDFTVTAMGDDGLPAYRLYAIYMEHREIEDTSELYEPELEIYRTDRQPLYITADKGWVTENNEVILLQGRVRMWEKNRNGEITLNVDTNEARVLLVEEYAETDQYAVIVNGKTTVTGYGVRAHLDENRLEVLKHEKTTIVRSDNL